MDNDRIDAKITPPRLRFTFGAILLAVLLTGPIVAWPEIMPGSVHPDQADPGDLITFGSVCCSNAMCGNPFEDDPFWDDMFNENAAMQRVHGRVVHDGVPVIGAVMSLLSKDRSSTAETTTDGQGKFEFIVPVGEYYLFDGPVPDGFDPDDRSIPRSLPVPIRARQFGGVHLESTSAPQTGQAPVPSAESPCPTR